MSLLLQRSVKVLTIVIATPLALIATQMVGLQVFTWTFGAGAGERASGTEMAALVLSALVSLSVAIATGYFLYKAKYSWITDKTKEIGVAIGLIVVVVGGTLLIDNYHEVKPEEFFMVFVSLSFFPLVGWDYRKQFKSLPFALFFFSWMVLHGAVFVIVMKSYGWGGYFIAMLAELFVFYISVKLIFGIDPPKPKDEDFDGNSAGMGPLL